MKCEKVLVRRGRTSILCQERTHSGWSGEDTPRSYVRKGQWTRLDPMSERTVDTPRPWSREGTPQSYVRRGQRTHLDPGQERILYTSILCQERTANTPRRGILHVRRGYTSILHCMAMAMGENNSIPKWLIGLKVRKKDGDEKKQT